MKKLWVAVFAGACLVGCNSSDTDYEGSGGSMQGAGGAGPGFDGGAQQETEQGTGPNSITGEPVSAAGETNSAAPAADESPSEQ